MTTIEQTDTTAPALPSWLTTAERQMVARFPRDVVDHQMTVLHDDGLYRHLRCTNQGSSFYWFEVVTWPGALAIRGDFGAGYIFSRVTDMFEFFRVKDGYGINPSYWAEKLPDSGRSVKVYSEEVLRARLADLPAEYAEGYPDLAAAYQRRKAEFDATPKVARWPNLIDGLREPKRPKTPAEVREDISDADLDGEFGHEDGARRLLSGLESAGVVSDTWEWDLSDWDWPFLWACHAIVWAIRRYDSARAAA